MNFIIYENEIQYMECYKETIHKLMGPSNLNYKIIAIDQINEKSKRQLTKLEEHRIYILDTGGFKKDGMDFAREIRNSGDWISPIIIVTNQEDAKIPENYKSKILMLDYISKKRNLTKNLFDALVIALEIVSRKKTLCFQMRGEIFQVSYHDILYIEKNLNDNSLMVITKEHEYQIRQTISNLENQLAEDPSFFKTHRSCIVNIKNIKHINFESGIITFENNKTTLLSRSNKKKLKERMGVVKNGCSVTCD